MGPTASGKTGLACELVKHFPFEIISVDSAMIYRGMDIGTAKPEGQLLAQAPHHLIDILNPTESYSAAQFCKDVHLLCLDIFKRGKIPLLVGGTMMYFRALQQGLSTLPQANQQVRAELLQLAEQQGWDYLHHWLAQVDPTTAARIHVHDTQRIQRALEVYQLSGKPLSELIDKETINNEWQFINLILMPQQRQWLHQRIHLRFDQMLKDGFILEVENLLSQWQLSMSNPSMRSVGYRQALEYIQGECDYLTFKEKGVAATRQLAKRQLTWLRHWPKAINFEADNPNMGDEVVANIKRILDNSEQ